MEDNILNALSICLHVPEGTLEENFTIILPTFNESGNIVKMVGCLRSFHPGASILIMDDDSPDGTGSKVTESYGDDGHVRIVIRQNTPKGLSASVIDGIELTTTKFFIVMDSDFQHPPQTVPLLMEKMDGGADVCVGVRVDRNALGAKRKLFSQGAELLSRSYLWFIGKQSSRDNMSGLFAGKTEMVSKCLQDNRKELEIIGFKVLFDIMKFIPSDARLEEITFNFAKREAGESKIGSGTIASILRQCGKPGRYMARKYDFFNERLKK